MTELNTLAAEWGIEGEYWDGLGRRRTVETETLSRLIDTLSKGGTANSKNFRFNDHASPHAYSGSETSPKRLWALAVQLYGVRSRRNWGHGDFTDLKALLCIAARLGAAGVGLNPLHAIFDDRPNEFSPYSPSSRLFLNTHYIDPDSIPEASCIRDTRAATLKHAARATALVDYAAVIRAKSHALAQIYRQFRFHASTERHADFAAFRKSGGPLLRRFCCFEILRRRFDGPWWDWPEEWRVPTDEKLAALSEEENFAADYYAFLQWTAETQLRECQKKAAELGLPIGLYLDIAVGVRADGFDAWNNQDVIERALEIGAPPDPLNLEGQRWGLAGVNPVVLADTQCTEFRRMLRATMQYAGAVRLDHAMGLQRLYLIPAGMRGDQGAYVGLPFEQLLRITVEESIAAKCIVIGEDLGTVPENFRERLGEAGIWSYQVMLFQRAKDGGFIAPDLYRENALATFATHDLPTFVGWNSGLDLSVKSSLGLDPGETSEERATAREAMARTIAWHGSPNLDYPGVIAFLASTPSRLLAVSMEDALAIADQVNVPGTIAEYPNWRRRLPIDLEDIEKHPLVKRLAEILSNTGRGNCP